MSRAVDIARRRVAEGFGFGPNIWDENGPTIWGGDGEAPTNNTGGVFRQPSDGDRVGPWDAQLPSLIGGGLQVLRDIFAPVGTSQAAYGSRTATQQYQQQYQYQQPPPGYGYNSSGQLVKQGVGNIASFITENPLLVGAGLLGVFLLFRQPPGRR